MRAYRCIEREKTSSQNSQGIALNFSIHFSHSNLRVEYNWKAIPAKYKLPHILIEVPAKSKCNALRFLMKKLQVLLHWCIFFNPFFKGSNVICQRGKTFFFHQKSEGIAFTFCRYLNQNMRAFKFCRYCLQKYFLIPSNFDEKKIPLYSEGNTLGILRRSFFP